MKTPARLLVGLVATLIRMIRPSGASAIVAENLLLEQQLLVLSRNRERAPNLRAFDRVSFALLSLFLRPRRIARAAIAVRPSTLLRFHRALARKKYQKLFTPRRGGKPGPKGPAAEIINAAIEINRRNPSFGCPPIALIINRMFVTEIDKDVVRRILVRHYRPEPGGGPSWLTFLAHTKHSLWSVDLFRCESLALRGWPRALSDVQCDHLWERFTPLPQSRSQPAFRIPSMESQSTCA